jgi:hypothetical protein
VSRRVQRVALTAHVAASVGWLGAVLVFFVLGLIGLTSGDAQAVRGVYVVMERAAWFTLLPLAFASLLTGLLQSLLTPWGLFRHYWVVFKLAINLFSTIFLVLYMGTFRAMADVASDPRAELDAVRSASPVLHAGVALVLLSTATVLAVFKPPGRTPYGRGPAA